MTKGLRRHHLLEGWTSYDHQQYGARSMLSYHKHVSLALAHIRLWKNINHSMFGYETFDMYGVT
jgi:hypothetical protein